MGFNGNSKYWTKEDRRGLRAAKSFKDLAEIALRVLARMPQPVCMVSGPITTGGKGSIKENLKVFKETIADLCSKGHVVFDQMPFEGPLHRIFSSSECQGEQQLLDEFYLPILKSGMVRHLHFIRGWESSVGARWECGRAAELRIERTYL